MLQLAILADGGRLAVAMRLGAVDAERGDRLLRQQLAEFLADRDQRREILDIAAGKGIFDHRDRRGAPRRRRDRLAHLDMGLLDHGDDLANDGAHRCLPSRSSMHELLSADVHDALAIEPRLLPPRSSRPAAAARRLRSGPPPAGGAHSLHRLSSASSISLSDKAPTSRVTSRAPRSLSGCSSFAGRRTTAGMAGQIDGIGDDRRGRIGHARPSSPAPSRHRQCRARSCGHDGRWSRCRGSDRRAPITMVRIRPWLSGRSIRPTVNCSPSARCSAMSPPLLT